jgi:hypothetical protein
MSHWRTILRGLLAGILLLLASCIDSREEFWIKADGSGRAHITYTIPATAARMHGGDAGIRKLIGDFLRATPSIKSTRHEVVTADGRTTAVVEFAFDSALDLMRTTSADSLDRLPAAASHFFGETDVRWSGRSLEITRNFSPGKALPGAALMPASQLDGRLVTIMHLPAAANDSNATRVENNGRTLVWETSFADAVKSPVNHRFNMNVPLPWGMLGWIATPIALLGGAVWIRRLRARPTT